MCGDMRNQINRSVLIKWKKRSGLNKRTGTERLCSQDFSYLSAVVRTKCRYVAVGPHILSHIV